MQCAWMFQLLSFNCAHFIFVQDRKKLSKNKNCIHYEESSVEMMMMMMTKMVGIASHKVKWQKWSWYGLVMKIGCWLNEMTSFFRQIKFQNKMKTAQGWLALKGFASKPLPAYLVCRNHEKKEKKKFPQNQVRRAIKNNCINPRVKAFSGTSLYNW